MKRPPRNAQRLLERRRRSSHPAIGKVRVCCEAQDDIHGFCITYHGFMHEALNHISRRRALVFIGAGAAAAALLLRDSIRHVLPREAAAVRDDADVRTNEVMLTSTAFMGALFGRELTAADRDELLERLDFSVVHAPGRLQGYADLKRHLDNSARRQGASEFSAAPVVIQARIVDRLMSTHYRRWQARLLRLLTGSLGQHYRIVVITVPALAWLYANSGVPWRARGYQRWQGIPGDWREILHAGPSIT
jgi:hypothetical protein